jgi:hypothetical protein
VENIINLNFFVTSASPLKPVALARHRLPSTIQIMKIMAADMAGTLQRASFHSVSIGIQRMFIYLQKLRVKWVSKCE